MKRIERNSSGARRRPLGEQLGRINLGKRVVKRSVNPEPPIDFDKHTENSKYPIVAVNVAEEIVRANKAAIEELGVEIGGNLGEKFNPDDAARFESEFLEKGLDGVTGAELMDINGITWKVRLELGKFRNEKDAFIFYFNKLTDEELAKSGMADYNLSQSVVASKGGKIIYENKVAEKLASEGVYIENTKKHKEMLQQLGEEEEAVDGRIRVKDLSGEIRVFDVIIVRQGDIVRTYSFEVTKLVAQGEYKRNNPGPIIKLRFNGKGEYRITDTNPAAHKEYPYLEGISSPEGIIIFEKIDMVVETMIREGVEVKDRLIEVETMSQEGEEGEQSTKYYEQTVVLLPSDSDYPDADRKIIIYTKNLTKLIGIQKKLKQETAEHKAAKEEAEEQRRIADEQRRIAEEQRRIAEKATKEADEARRIADEQRRIAEEQRRIAEEQTGIAEEAATKDKLTGLFNYGHLSDVSPGHIANAKRADLPMTQMMIDMDKFKSVNDTFGHVAANEVLKIVAEVLKDNTREGDIVCRFGGDEFTIILIQCKENVVSYLADHLPQEVEKALKEALEPGGRVRIHIEEEDFDESMELTMTLGYHTAYPRAEAWAKPKAEAKTKVEAKVEAEIWAKAEIWARPQAEARISAEIEAEYAVITEIESWAKAKAKAEAESKNENVENKFDEYYTKYLEERLRVILEGYVKKFIEEYFRGNCEEGFEIDGEENFEEYCAKYYTQYYAKYYEDNLDNYVQEYLRFDAKKRMEVEIKFEDEDFERESVELTKKADRALYKNKKAKNMGGKPASRRTGQFNQLDSARETIKNIKDYFANTRGEKERRRKAKEKERESFELAQRAKLFGEIVSGQHDALERRPVKEEIQS